MRRPAGAGYASGARRVPRRVQRRVQHRGRGPRPRWHRAGTGRAAELASEAARAEGASHHRPPPVASRRGGRAGRQARMASAPGPALRRGAGHSRLTAGHRAPAAPPGPGRAWRQPGRGETPPGPPSSARPDRHGRAMPARAAEQEAAGDAPLGTQGAEACAGRSVTRVRRSDCNARLACLPCCYVPLVPLRAPVGSSRTGISASGRVTIRSAPSASRPGPAPPRAAAVGTVLDAAYSPAVEIGFGSSIAAEKLGGRAWRRVARVHGEFHQGNSTLRELDIRA
jgi:hypothetical protein